MYYFDKAEDDYTKYKEGGKIKVGELYSDNIIVCLLILDGIAMINPDASLLISYYVQYSGKTLNELIFMILNNNFLDFHIKDVASHILCRRVSIKINFNNLELIQ